jgi:hypothetical protein
MVIFILIGKYADERSLAMSANKDRDEVLPDVNQQPKFGRQTEEQSSVHEQEIGRVNNDRTQGLRQEVPVEQQEIGRINNERQPHLHREIQPEEREIGIINNEHEPRLQRVIFPEEREIGLVNNSKLD